ncbi:MAG: aspartyl protease family protein [Acidobacteriota bacterium]
MTIRSRPSSLCIVATAVLLGAIVGGSAALEPETGAAGTRCDHEIVYEAFARLILVPVTIGDSPQMDFVLDSGATQSSITDPYLAEALGLGVRDVGLARGMGSGAVHVLITGDVSVRSQGFELLHTPLVVHDIGERLAAIAGRDIHGFLGADLFERYVVEIDPEEQRLLLHDPRTYSYRGEGEELPLEIVDRRPVVKASVVVDPGSKPVPVRLVVDTGSSRYLTLITGSRRRLKPPPERTLGGSVGVVGAAVVVLGPVQRLELGSRTAGNVETAWMEGYQIPAVRNIPKLNGVLGNALLRRFRVIFDYRGARMILEEISGFSDTMNENPD